MSKKNFLAYNFLILFDNGLKMIDTCLSTIMCYDYTAINFERFYLFPQGNFYCQLQIIFSNSQDTIVSKSYYRANSSSYQQTFLYTSSWNPIIFDTIHPK